MKKDAAAALRAIINALMQYGITRFARDPQ